MSDILCEIVSRDILISMMCLTPYPREVYDVSVIYVLFYWLVGNSDKCVLMGFCFA